MGFWTVYFGLYGGGTAVVQTPPTVPGAEYRLEDDRSHYRLDKVKLAHARLDDGRPHYYVTEE